MTGKNSSPPASKLPGARHECVVSGSNHHAYARGMQLPREGKKPILQRFPRVITAI